MIIKLTSETYSDRLIRKKTETRNTILCMLAVLVLGLFMFAHVNDTQRVEIEELKDQFKIQERYTLIEESRANLLQSIVDGQNEIIKIYREEK